MSEKLADAVGIYLRKSTGMSTQDERTAERIGHAVVCYLLGISTADSVIRYVDKKFEQFCVDHAGDLTLTAFADRLSHVNQVLSSTTTLEDVNHDRS